MRSGARRKLDADGEQVGAETGGERSKGAAVARLLGRFHHRQPERRPTAHALGGDLLHAAVAADAEAQVAGAVGRALRRAEEAVHLADDVLAVAGAGTADAAGADGEPLPAGGVGIGIPARRRPGLVAVAARTVGVAAGARLRAGLPRRLRGRGRALCGRALRRRPRGCGRRLLRLAPRRWLRLGILSRG